jgi:hypothetical protein
VRGIKVKRLVQKRIKERVEAHRSLAMVPAVLVALRSGSGSLVAEMSRERARVQEGVEALL